MKNKLNYWIYKYLLMKVPVRFQARFIGRNLTGYGLSALETRQERNSCIYRLIWGFSLIILPAIAVGLMTGCKSEEAKPPEEWRIQAQTNFGRQPLWSPEGSHILFGDDRLGQPGLYVWDITSDPQPLLEGPLSHNWDYRWSPNGDQVAFSAPGETGDSLAGVWVVTIADGSRRRVSDRGRDVSWQTDGMRIAVRIDNPRFGAPGLFDIDLESDTLFQIVAGGYQPAYSPAGGWLSYSVDEIRGELRLRSPEGVVTTAATAGIVQWKWSAEGNCIAAIWNDYTSGDLTGYLLKIRTTGNVGTVDTLARWAGYPAPNRDGSQVAFLRMSNGAWAGLWLRRGGEELRIAGYGLSPDFDPGGNRIAAHATGGGIRIFARG
ncbi:MAG: hypothetical protein V2A61_02735 [Calditrichota bacterium]